VQTGKHEIGKYEICVGFVESADKKLIGSVGTGIFINDSGTALLAIATIADLIGDDIERFVMDMRMRKSMIEDQKNSPPHAGN
jgi:hypothetical protein